MRTARVAVEDRREQLVAATTRAICTEAGASPAAFHYCSASKRELLIAWTLHLEQLARMLVVVTDGITLAWLADLLAAHSVPPP